MDYRTLSNEELEQHFNPRVAATNVDEKIAAMGTRSTDVRAVYTHTANLSYGDAPGETLDVFHSGKHGGDAPVQLFIHGGYWRAMDKSNYSFVAPPFVDRGGVVVVINYDLAPSVTLDEIVEQCARSVVWTHRNITRFGGDPSRIYLSGNSAGGHLVGMLIARDWADDGLPTDVIKGAAPVTGVMDCRPVLKISVNEDVRLDAAMAERQSPVDHPPHQTDLPLIVAVGGAEPAGWVELSRAYVRACEQAGLKPRYMEMPGMDHFDMSAAFGDADSPLTQAILRQMGLLEG